MDILSKFTSYLAFWGRREGERRGRGGGGEGRGRGRGGDGEGRGKRDTLPSKATVISTCLQPLRFAFSENDRCRCFRNSTVFFFLHY